MKKEDTDKSSGVQKDESKEGEGGLKFNPQGLLYGFKINRTTWTGKCTAKTFLLLDHSRIPNPFNWCVTLCVQKSFTSISLRCWILNCG